MDEKVVRNTLSDDMLKHDIAVRKAIDLITDNAKEVSKKSTKSSTKKSTAKKSTEKKTTKKSSTKKSDKD